MQHGTLSKEREKLEIAMTQQVQQQQLNSPTMEKAMEMAGEMVAEWGKLQWQQMAIGIFSKGRLGLPID